MALVPYTITALAESDAQGTDGKNIVAGATCSMYSQPSDSVVTLYDDAAGSNGSTSKVTGANGQVVVYVEQGRYRLNVNAADSFVSVSSDVPIDVDTFANLSASSPVQDGQRFVCQERGNANYILQANGYVALPGDVTFDNGRVGALQIDGPANIKWFGGKVDDLTDDTDSANNGLLRLNQDGGGDLFIPSGVCRANIVHTYDKVGITGEGRSSVIAPTTGTCLDVNGISGGFGGLITDITLSGVNGATTGLKVDGFSRGKFGNLWLIEGLDYALDIDGDGSTEFTFENVYIHNPILRAVRYSRTNDVDTGGVYFDTLHATGPAATAKGFEVTSSHTSRTRAFLFINKLILDNFSQEAMLLENVESFFISQMWATGTAPSYGMLTVRDIKDCMINQAWLQNSSATGYNLLVSGGASSDETADMQLDQLRTSGPGTAAQFNGSPTLSRCNIGQWNDTSSTKTNDAARLSQMRSNILEGDLDVQGDLDVGGLNTSSNMVSDGYLTVAGKVNFGAGFPTLNVAAGAVTTTSSAHRIAPESGTTDDLNTINGGTQGDRLVLMVNSSANAITVKHGTGNIYLDGSVDLVLNSSRDKLELVYFGTEWQQISFSNNS